MARGGPTSSRTARAGKRVPKGQIDPYRTDPKIMPGRTIDFTGVGDYKPASAGNYTLELVKYSFEESGASSKNPGSEYVKAQTAITDETDEMGEPVQGKVVFVNWSLLPQALWNFKGAAIAFGIDPTRLEGAVDIEAILGDMQGRKAIGTVTVEEYKYPAGHAKHGQSRWSNQVTDWQQADIPEALSPASRRRG